MSTAPGGPDDDWHPHVFRMPDWVEAFLIVTILFTSMFLTRTKNYSIFASSNQNYSQLTASPASGSPRTSIDSDPNATYRTDYPNKTRRVFGTWTVRTPNSSRFARHIHSRILQKFPFLVEMFYWVLQFFFYRLTANMAAAYYGGSDNLWEKAQNHGIALLELETAMFGRNSLTGTTRWIEWNVQQWFLTGARAGDFRGIFLTILNRSYSLIHIPGTVGFIAFYYYVSPTFTRFATVRRTMTLLNLFAFTIFILYPCMPPRLLPSEYGFIDTVNGEDATSVWQSGNFVNRLAAMPSMHFGYAFCIGLVFIYESAAVSGVKEIYRRYGKTRNPSQTWLPVPNSDEESQGSIAGVEAEEHSTSERSTRSRIAFFAFGVWYPSWVLLTIVATANHYLMDAMVATLVVMMGFLCNRVLLNFLPLEDLLLWAWRLEKPVPTTGMRRRRPLRVDPPVY
ncbi:integral membrane protein [Diaporthe helianthi]|uniref:Integral membrane protein n=1 Tax=Diaporthe helianthi TaxID=158607 RepID=A0A2P5I0E0_DIAHE|nr:integral membrane protein [Diaporthe helianthi]